MSHRVPRDVRFVDNFPEFFFVIITHSFMYTRKIDPDRRGVDFRLNEISAIDELADRRTLNHAVEYTARRYTEALPIRSDRGSRNSEDVGLVVSREDLPIGSARRVVSLVDYEEVRLGHAIQPPYQCLN